MINTSASLIVSHTDMSEMVNMVNRFFVKKLQILCSLDYPILFKFRQRVVNVVSEELQIIFWTSTVSNSIRNMKEL